MKNDQFNNIGDVEFRNSDSFQRVVDSMFVYECVKCGALVADIECHTEWHDELTTRDLEVYSWADEIKRLRAEVERLTDELQQVANEIALAESQEARRD